eukprot:TRINITY_DN247_c0_g1_i4.p1 TRINITY_DN247_c0_g1~~TRINITY_DN247_c0_g1_i4.p1  ORF type:complete len:427 (+),score=158.97 TRINITY_DN247_c0_g1_i4:88-1281(+)
MATDTKTTSAAPRLTPAQASQHLDILYHKFALEAPELSSELSEISELYGKKYWHQLTEKLQKFVSLDHFNKGDELIGLYNNFIREFEGKINPLSFSQIIIKLARQFKDPKEAIAFLEGIAEKQKANKEAYLTLLTKIASLQLEKQEFEQSKKTVEESRTLLNSLTGVDQNTYSSFYFAASEYHRQRGTPAEFYNNGLLYLAYTLLETIPEDKKKALAFDLSLAALVGENIYNFGELLSHPIIETLKNTSFEWIVGFLNAFNHGDITKYEQLVAEFQAVLHSQPALVANQHVLKEKISILALMELLSGRDRVVSFETIAAAVKLPLDQIELLVMKALSLKLVKGTIDEVEKVVSFTWVQPRILTLPQIQSMNEKLHKWMETVSSTHLFIENQVPELIA